MTKQTLTIGTTIHDETVEIIETGKLWKVTLDGQMHGRYDSFEGCLVTAARLVPSHRRVIGADWSF